MEMRIQQLWQRGLVHHREGNLDAAQACFEGILRRERRHAPAFFRLAMIYLQRGTHGHAAFLAEQALALDPEQAAVLALLAKIHLAAGSVVRACEFALRAAQRPLDSAITLDALGAVFSQLAEHERALEMFDAAIDLPAPTPDLYYNRALAQRAAGAIASFEHDLKTCLSLEPGHAKAHWHLAQQRRRGRSANRVEFLRGRLEQRIADPFEQQMFALALFHELDGLGRSVEAWQVLDKIFAERRALPAREPLPWETLASIVPEPLALPSGTHGPVFIVGMPRSGVAVLARLLQRHPQVRSLGTVPVFQRRLHTELTRLNERPISWPLAGALLATVDYEALGRDYLREVAADDDTPICEAVPMNALLVGAIARALPRARFLHVTRDIQDNALSLLAMSPGDAGLANADVASLAAEIGSYDDLMLHWQDVLPGRMIDVQYESLVHKPEMVLRVACGFLGLRYQPSLLAHDLHERRIGRALAYADKLVALTEPA